jgi:hypothetical protein
VSVAGWLGIVVIVVAVGLIALASSRRPPDDGAGYGDGGL